MTKEETQPEQTKTQKIKDKINKYTPTPETIKKTLNKTIILLIFGLTVIFMYWINKATTPENSILIMFITLSVLVNLTIILILIGTGIGRELITRFLNQFRYKTGNYVNTLHILKSGVIRERFVKKDPETGTFRILDKPYITTAQLMLSYKNIPSYLHREGNPDPLDVWDKGLTGDLSNSEMDIAMNSKGAFDVKEWLEKNKLVLFYGAILVIGICAVTGYFGYSAYEMLRDGTFKQATEVVCKNIPKIAETISNTQL